MIGHRKSGTDWNIKNPGVSWRGQHTHAAAHNYEPVEGKKRKIHPMNIKNEGM